MPKIGDCDLNCRTFFKWCVQSICLSVIMCWEPKIIQHYNLQSPLHKKWKTKSLTFSTHCIYIHNLLHNIYINHIDWFITVQPIKFSTPMLSVALSCSPKLYHATNPHSLALLKVVKVSATEEGLQHLENFMGCTVYCFSSLLYLL